MAHYVEDEVDWSDGTLDSPHRSPFEPESVAASQTVPEEITTPHEAHHPEKSPLAAYLQNLIEGRPARPNVVRTNAAKKASIGKPHHLTTETMSNFALYQANQKIYEAMFLKTFLAHALDPDALDINEYLDDMPDVRAKLESYLRLVASNVDQIVDKMIWNAHFKCINMLAHDEKSSLPFLNVDLFKQDLFLNFGAHSSFPVVAKMNQSWHRVYNKSAMVRYTTEDYPVNPHDAKVHAPLDEVQEASRTLLNTHSSSRVMSKGRIFKQPSKKLHCHRNSNHQLQPEEPVVSREDVSPSLAADPTTRQQSPVREPTSLSNECNVALNGRNYTDEDPDTINSSVQAARLATLHDFSVMFPDREMSRLEALVASSDPNEALPDIENTASAKEPLPMSEYTGGWRTLLINDHKRRPAQAALRSQQPEKRLPRSIKGVIARAVAKGILKAPAPEVQQQIDAHAAKSMRVANPLSINQRGKRKVAAPPQIRKQINEKPLLSVVPQTNSGKVCRGALSRSVKQGWDISGVHKSKGKRKKTQTHEPPRKKVRVETDTQRAATSSNKTKTYKPRKDRDEGVYPKAKAVTVHKVVNQGPLPPHASGSKTLESHQVLPDEAYFEKAEEDDKPAWRCGIRHALGYYYNAGDRKHCPGCFTNIRENPKMKLMDFYLPSMTCFHQPAPDIIWKPSKASGKPRKGHASHNGIAKDAYWAAISSGATEDEARQKGVEAVEEYLRPKPKPEPEPTPEPEPEPEPIDLGPHPSGSTIMEHGQGIPECHYFDKKERHEEFAWRCDGGHALGRYYMAGDRRTCPGCGSNKSGLGRRTEMDFYMPPGSVIRQEAPGLVEWRPRKPYKTKGTKKFQLASHNQICSRKYWDAVEKGMEHEDALVFAIRETDAELDAKMAAIEVSESGQSESQEDASSEVDEAGEDDGMEYNVDGGTIISLVPRDNMSDDEPEETDEEELGEPPVIEIPNDGDSSSDDISSSSSDSE